MENSSIKLSCQKVVGCCYSMDVTCQVKIKLLHRNHQWIPSTRTTTWNTQYKTLSVKFNVTVSQMYTRVNKNPLAWNFLSPKPEVTCSTVAIIIQVVLLSPYLRIHAVSLSSIHYNQSQRLYINRRRQYICLIWN